MASADRGAGAADWIERWGNPFLLREWRRASRAKATPLVGPMIFCGLGVILYVVMVGVCYGLVQLPAYAGVGLPVSGSLLGNGARLIGSWLIGCGAWIAIALAWWLSVSQTWLEEQQTTLDLLLATPLSRGRIVRHLLAWPLLNILLYLVPLLPLLASLMPLLGLSFAGSLRVLAVIFGGALLVMVRAPSGAAVRAEQATRRNVLDLGLWALTAVVVVPIASALAVNQLGLEGFGLIRWPLAVAELMVRRAPFWSGSTALGFWLVTLFGLLLAARLLAAWARLAEGSEDRYLSATAVSTPAWLLTLYLLAGLWWGHQTGASPEPRLWHGLHVAVGVLLWSTALAGPRPRWLWLFAPAGRLEKPVALAVLRLLDLLGVVALAPLLWSLAMRHTGGSPAPSSWDPTIDLGLAALVIAAITEAMRRGLAGRSRTSAVVRALKVLAALGFAGWAIAGLSRASVASAGGWTAGFSGWPLDVRLLLLGLGLFSWLLPALAWRPRADVAGAEREAGASWLLRVLPARWRDNPLMVKSQRILRRRGWSRTTLVVVGLAILLGLSPVFLIAWFGAQQLQQIANTGTLVLLVAISGLVRLGGWLAWHGFALSLPPAAAAMLAVAVISAAVVAIPAVVAAAALCGRVITDERLGGSLGFLLLSDLSDEEIAAGYLLGQLQPVLEPLLLYLLGLAIWSLAGLHPLVGLVAAALTAYLLGLLVSTAGLAFLGTARYDSKASGTMIALVGMLAFHASCLFAILVFPAMALARHPEMYGPMVSGSLLIFCLLTALSGGLIWASLPGALRRMRRPSRLWLAFEPTGTKE